MGRAANSRGSMLTLAILTYAAAMTLANLSVAAFGPAISPVNAFFLIGLDLTMRDWLHVRIKAWQMGLLIAGTGLLTYVLNPAAGMIAIASSVAFTAAALVDWATFTRLRGSWMFRANGSNVAGAAVDSLIFPTIAFGALMPQIVIMQFVAKVAGGAIWAKLLSRYEQPIR
jgi:queuosine precursor transporter